jgi:hypothetical protein
MTDNNTVLINRISDYITSQNENITKYELKKAVGEIFDEVVVKKSKKKNSEASNRPLSKYNNFIKEYMAILKEQSDNTMTAKQKMAHIAVLWKQQKEEKKEEDEEKPKGKTPRKALGPVK